MALHIHIPTRGTTINYAFGIIALALFVGGWLAMFNQKLQLPLLPSNVAIGFSMILASGVTLLMWRSHSSTKQ